MLITGSSTGIGQAAAVALIAQGHEVVLHARNEERARQAEAAAKGAIGVAIGDLSTLAGTHELALQAEKFGAFDTVVLNAGLGTFVNPERRVTDDGNELIFQVNTLSSYLLTALLPRPKRLIFTSSALAGAGVLDLDDPNYERRPYQPREAYCSTKLHLVLLALAFGRHWEGTESIAFDPGWVSTQMTRSNGDDAPLTPEHAGARLARLAIMEKSATSYDTERAWRPGDREHDHRNQEELLAVCAKLTGVTI
ncbi:NAD(P)-dependent dehydrogenase (short-subunit alcohol dehydrogenase family) [Catenuloplanes nepalensis]|uniref:NAD(P)-dependent dehydrogenase (Short-subunit alcohol dehydrogenase family) n=1 Tax=Catenuloplanes nepalensis TaxID=587533 RepID=A0ABT9MLC3_9ACTN|nr:SDR family NAD(P)-dependent oxidoreductase [Catenuloplanes nepalensis]MDP9792225.1 NAD(P)-dependent dehydrogenase (short-subunit alcohol dehydrogenase family) [Catenuloplanes nepalensis]